ncbi:hypothetical protein [Streptomyces sp. ISL-100]|uniref:hypothetical protein n=1 Tax=Streptomyces sp. ISL-100 TaxID=2819173 RepID=UPI001BEAEA06|nr:hypothetical protein [Streptomyces sp. ISL-100]MBT2401085.1 hypothetical protein [Streptomyces sp. ISL-100]
MTEQLTPPATTPEEAPGPPPPAETPAETPAEAPAAAPRPPRRVLRAVARWTAAVLVCGGLGTGSAFGIAALERTDVPGLATEHDGRWDYPELSLPALPAGSPRPYSEGNDAEIHHADLRRLMLSAPAGASPDKRLTGDWITTGQYASAYAKGERSRIREALRDSAVRHIAGRGWTMPDGTTSWIYLLRFNSVAYAEGFKDDVIRAGLKGGALLREAPVVALDEQWSSLGTAGTVRAYVYVEEKPYGAGQVRQAYIVAGDTLALVTHSRKGSAVDVPFYQSLILQAQLLG